MSSTPPNEQPQTTAPLILPNPDHTTDLIVTTLFETPNTSTPSSTPHTTSNLISPHNIPHSSSNTLLPHPQTPLPPSSYLHPTAPQLQSSQSHHIPPSTISTSLIHNRPSGHSQSTSAQPIYSATLSPPTHQSALLLGDLSSSSTPFSPTSHLHHTAPLPPAVSTTLPIPSSLDYIPTPFHQHQLVVNHPYPFHQSHAQHVQNLPNMSHMHQTVQHSQNNTHFHTANHHLTGQTPLHNRQQQHYFPSGTPAISLSPATSSYTHANIHHHFQSQNQTSNQSGSNNPNHPSSQDHHFFDYCRRPSIVAHDMQDQISTQSHRQEQRHTSTTTPSIDHSLATTPLSGSPPLTTATMQIIDLHHATQPRNHHQHDSHHAETQSDQIHQQNLLSAMPGGHIAQNTNESSHFVTKNAGNVPHTQTRFTHIDHKSSHPSTDPHHTSQFSNSGHLGHSGQAGSDFYPQTNTLMNSLVVEGAVDMTDMVNDCVAPSEPAQLPPHHHHHHSAHPHHHYHHHHHSHHHHHRSNHHHTPHINSSHPSSSQSHSVTPDTSNPTQGTPHTSHTLTSFSPSSLNFNIQPQIDTAIHDHRPHTLDSQHIQSNVLPYPSANSIPNPPPHHTKSTELNDIDVSTPSPVSVPSNDPPHSPSSSAHPPSYLLPSTIPSGHRKSPIDDTDQNKQSIRPQNDNKTTALSSQPPNHPNSLPISTTDLTTAPHGQQSQNTSTSQKSSQPIPSSTHLSSSAVNSNLQRIDPDQTNQHPKQPPHTQPRLLHHNQHPTFGSTSSTSLSTITLPPPHLLYRSEPQLVTDLLENLVYKAKNYRKPVVKHEYDDDNDSYASQTRSNELHGPHRKSTVLDVKNEREKDKMDKMDKIDDKLVSRDRSDKRLDGKKGEVNVDKKSSADTRPVPSTCPADELGKSRQFKYPTVDIWDPVANRVAQERKNQATAMDAGESSIREAGAHSESEKSHHKNVTKRVSNDLNIHSEDEKGSKDGRHQDDAKHHHQEKSTSHTHSHATPTSSSAHHKDQLQTDLIKREKLEKELLQKELGMHLESSTHNPVIITSGGLFFHEHPPSKTKSDKKPSKAVKAKTTKTDLNLGESSSGEADAGQGADHFVDETHPVDMGEDVFQDDGNEGETDGDDEIDLGLVDDEVNGLIEDILSGAEAEDGGFYEDPALDLTPTASYTSPSVQLSNKNEDTDDCKTPNPRTRGADDQLDANDIPNGYQDDSSEIYDDSSSDVDSVGFGSDGSVVNEIAHITTPNQRSPYSSQRYIHAKHHAHNHHSHLPHGNHQIPHKNDANDSALNSNDPQLPQIDISHSQLITDRTSQPPGGKLPIRTHTQSIGSTPNHTNINTETLSQHHSFFNSSEVDSSSLTLNTFHNNTQQILSTLSQHGESSYILSNSTTTTTSPVPSSPTHIDPTHYHTNHFSPYNNPHSTKHQQNPHSINPAPFVSPPTNTGKPPTSTSKHKSHTLQTDQQQQQRDPEYSSPTDSSLAALRLDLLPSLPNAFHDLRNGKSTTTTNNGNVISPQPDTPHVDLELAGLYTPTIDDSDYANPRNTNRLKKYPVTSQNSNVYTPSSLTNDSSLRFISPGQTTTGDESALFSDSSQLQTPYSDVSGSSIGDTDNDDLANFNTYRGQRGGNLPYGSKQQAFGGSEMQSDHHRGVNSNGIDDHDLDQDSDIRMRMGDDSMQNSSDLMMRSSQSNENHDDDHEHSRSHPHSGPFRDTSDLHSVNDVTITAITGTTATTATTAPSVTGSQLNIYNNIMNLPMHRNNSQLKGAADAAQGTTRVAHRGTSYPNQPSNNRILPSTSTIDQTTDLIIGNSAQTGELSSQLKVDTFSPTRFGHDGSGEANHVREALFTPNHGDAVDVFAGLPVDPKTFQKQQKTDTKAPTKGSKLQSSSRDDSTQQIWQPGAIRSSLQHSQSTRYDSSLIAEIRDAKLGNEMYEPNGYLPDARFDQQAKYDDVDKNDQMSKRDRRTSTREKIVSDDKNVSKKPSRRDKHQQHSDDSDIQVKTSPHHKKDHSGTLPRNHPEAQHKNDGDVADKEEEQGQAPSFATGVDQSDDLLFDIFPSKRQQEISSHGLHSPHVPPGRAVNKGGANEDKKQEDQKKDTNSSEYVSGVAPKSRLDRSDRDRTRSDRDKTDKAHTAHAHTHGTSSHHPSSSSSSSSSSHMSNVRIYFAVLRLPIILHRISDLEAQSLAQIQQQLSNPCRQSSCLGSSALHTHHPYPDLYSTNTDHQFQKYTQYDHCPLPPTAMRLQSQKEKKCMICGLSTCFCRDSSDQYEPYCTPNCPLYTHSTHYSLGFKQLASFGHSNHSNQPSQRNSQTHPDKPCSISPHTSSELIHPSQLFTPQLTPCQCAVCSQTQPLNSAEFQTGQSSQPRRCHEVSPFSVLSDNDLDPFHSHTTQSEAEITGNLSRTTHSFNDDSKGKNTAPFTPPLTLSIPTSCTSQYGPQIKQVIASTVLATHDDNSAQHPHIPTSSHHSNNTRDNSPHSPHNFLLTEPLQPYMDSHSPHHSQQTIQKLSQRSLYENKRYHFLPFTPQTTEKKQLFRRNSLIAAHSSQRTDDYSYGYDQHGHKVQSRQNNDHNNQINVGHDPSSQLYPKLGEGPTGRSSTNEWCFEWDHSAGCPHSFTNLLSMSQQQHNLHKSMSRFNISTDAFHTLDKINHVQGGERERPFGPKVEQKSNDKDKAKSKQNTVSSSSVVSGDNTHVLPQPIHSNDIRDHNDHRETRTNKLFPSTDVSTSPLNLHNFSLTSLSSPQPTHQMNKLLSDADSMYTFHPSTSHQRLTWVGMLPLSTYTQQTQHLTASDKEYIEDLLYHFNIIVVSVDLKVQLQHLYFLTQFIIPLQNLASPMYAHQLNGGVVRARPQMTSLDELDTGAPNTNALNPYQTSSSTALIEPVRSSTNPTHFQQHGDTSTTQPLQSTLIPFQHFEHQIEQFFQTLYSNHSIRATSAEQVVQFENERRALVASQNLSSSSQSQTTQSTQQQQLYLDLTGFCTCSQSHTVDNLWQNYLSLNISYSGVIQSLDPHSSSLVMTNSLGLALLPSSIRQRTPNINVCFWLTGAFMPSEMFRHVPTVYRTTMTRGLLSADVLMVKNRQFSRHILSTARRTLDITFTATDWGVSIDHYGGVCNMFVVQGACDVVYVLCKQQEMLLYLNIRSKYKEEYKERQLFLKNQTNKQGSGSQIGHQSDNYNQSQFQLQFPPSSHSAHGCHNAGNNTPDTPGIGLDMMSSPMSHASLTSTASIVANVIGGATSTSHGYGLNNTGLTEMLNTTQNNTNTVISKYTTPSNPNLMMKQPSLDEIIAIEDSSSHFKLITMVHSDIGMYTSLINYLHSYYDNIVVSNTTGTVDGKSTKNDYKAANHPTMFDPSREVLPRNFGADSGDSYKSDSNIDLDGDSGCDQEPVDLTPDIVILDYISPIYFPYIYSLYQHSITHSNWWSSDETTPFDIQYWLFCHLQTQHVDIPLTLQQNTQLGHHSVNKGKNTSTIPSTVSTTRTNNLSTTDSISLHYHHHPQRPQIPSCQTIQNYSPPLLSTNTYHHPSLSTVQCSHEPLSIPVQLLPLLFCITNILYHFGPHCYKPVLPTQFSIYNTLYFFFTSSIIVLGPTTPSYMLPLAVLSQTNTTRSTSSSQSTFSSSGTCSSASSTHSSSYPSSSYNTPSTTAQSTKTTPGIFNKSIKANPPLSTTSGEAQVDCGNEKLTSTQSKGQHYATLGQSDLTLHTVHSQGTLEHPHNHPHNQDGQFHRLGECSDVDGSDLKLSPAPNNNTLAEHHTLSFPEISSLVKTARFSQYAQHTIDLNPMRVSEDSTTPSLILSTQPSDTFNTTHFSCEKCHNHYHPSTHQPSCDHSCSTHHGAHHHHHHHHHDHNHNHQEDQIERNRSYINDFQNKPPATIICSEQLLWQFDGVYTINTHNTVDFFTLLHFFIPPPHHHSIPATFIHSHSGMTSSISQSLHHHLTSRSSSTNNITPFTAFSSTSLPHHHVPQTTLNKLCLADHYQRYITILSTTNMIHNVRTLYHLINDSKYRRNQTDIILLGFNQLRVVCVRKSFKIINQPVLIEGFKLSTHRLILLDYDGTLVPTFNTSNAIQTSLSTLTTSLQSPNTIGILPGSQFNQQQREKYNNTLPEKIHDLLKVLTSDPQNIVFILSGRSISNMTTLFKDLPAVGLVAEEGVCIRLPQHFWYFFQLWSQFKATRNAGKGNEDKEQPKSLKGPDQFKHLHNTADTAGNIDPINTITVTSVDIRNNTKNTLPSTSMNQLQSPTSPLNNNNSQSVHVQQPISPPWETIIDIPDLSWMDVCHDIMIEYATHTDGAYVERKEYSLIWYYTHSDPQLGSWQANEMSKVLTNTIKSLQLGNKKKKSKSNAGRDDQDDDHDASKGTNNGKNSGNENNSDIPNNVEPDSKNASSTSKTIPKTFSTAKYTIGKHSTAPKIKHSDESKDNKDQEADDDSEDDVINNIIVLTYEQQKMVVVKHRKVIKGLATLYIQKLLYGNFLDDYDDYLTSSTNSTGQTKDAAKESLSLPSKDTQSSSTAGKNDSTSLNKDQAHLNAVISGANQRPQKDGHAEKSDPLQKHSTHPTKLSTRRGNKDYQRLLAMLDEGMLATLKQYPSNGLFLAYTHYLQVVNTYQHYLQYEKMHQDTPNNDNKTNQSTTQPSLHSQHMHNFSNFFFHQSYQAMNVAPFTLAIGDSISDESTFNLLNVIPMTAKLQQSYNNLVQSWKDGAFGTNSAGQGAQSNNPQLAHGSQTLRNTVQNLKKLDTNNNNNNNNTNALANQDGHSTSGATHGTGELKSKLSMWNMNMESIGDVNDNEQNLHQNMNSTPAIANEISVTDGLVKAIPAPAHLDHNPVPALSVNITTPSTLKSSTSYVNLRGQSNMLAALGALVDEVGDQLAPALTATLSTQSLQSLLDPALDVPSAPSAASHSDQKDPSSPKNINDDTNNANNTNETKPVSIPKLSQPTFLTPNSILPLPGLFTTSSDFAKPHSVSQPSSLPNAPSSAPIPVQLPLLALPPSLPSLPPLPLPPPPPPPPRTDIFNTIITTLKPSKSLLEMPFLSFPSADKPIDQPIAHNLSTTTLSGTKRADLATSPETFAETASAKDTVSIDTSSQLPAMTTHTTSDHDATTSQGHTEQDQFGTKLLTIGTSTAPAATVNTDTILANLSSLLHTVSSTLQLQQAQQEQQQQQQQQAQQRPQPQQQSQHQHQHQHQPVQPTSSSQLSLIPTAFQEHNQAQGSFFPGLTATITVGLKPSDAMAYVVDEGHVSSLLEAVCSIVKEQQQEEQNQANQSNMNQSNAFYGQYGQYAQYGQYPYPRYGQYRQSTLPPSLAFLYPHHHPLSPYNTQSSQSNRTDRTANASKNPTIAPHHNLATQLALNTNQFVPPSQPPQNSNFFSPTLPTQFINQSTPQPYVINPNLQIFNQIQQDQQQQSVPSFAYQISPHDIGAEVNATSPSEMTPINSNWANNRSNSPHYSRSHSSSMLINSIPPPNAFPTTQLPNLPQPNLIDVNQQQSGLHSSSSLFPLTSLPQNPAGMVVHPQQQIPGNYSPSFTHEGSINTSINDSIHTINTVQTLQALPDVSMLPLLPSNSQHAIAFPHHQPIGKFNTLYLPSQHSSQQQPQPNLSTIFSQLPSPVDDNTPLSSYPYDLYGNPRSRNPNANQ